MHCHPFEERPVLCPRHSILRIFGRVCSCSPHTILCNVDAPSFDSLLSSCLALVLLFSRSVLCTILPKYRLVLTFELAFLW